MITSLQSDLALEQSRISSLQHQLNGCQRNLETSKKELEDYRAKATRTLQTKDKLIASLREDPSRRISSDTTTLELNSVKNERGLLREELVGLHVELDNLRVELTEAELQSANERDLLEEKEQDALRKWKQSEEKNENTFEELSKLKQELSFAHEEIREAKILHADRVKEMEEEVVLLHQSLAAKEVSLSARPDLETRLSALAENLIDKQTVIESLQTERSSLKLQLERLSSANASSRNYSQTAVNIPFDDHEDSSGGLNARMRIPQFLRETPMDTGVTRGVKR